MLRIFSTALVDPEEDYRGSGPSSVFLKDKDFTHTFNNKGQNCMECKLNDPPRGQICGLAYWTILPLLLPGKKSEFVIFGFEKDL